MQRSSENKYIIVAGMSFLVVVSAAIYLTLTNDPAENDMRFWIETILIGLAVNIFSSVILMVFFSRRDARNRQRKQTVMIRRLSGLTRRMMNYMTELEKRPRLSAEYTEKVQKFVNTAREVEETYLFEMDRGLLEALERVTFEPEKLEAYSAESVAALEKAVKGIQVRLDKKISMRH